MDRRAFLKSLLALGAGCVIPLDFSRASEREIEQSWSQAIDDPGMFYVGSSGTLFAEQDEEDQPTSRAEMYEIDFPETREEMVALLNSRCDIESPLENFFYELPEAEWPSDWEQWLMTSDEAKFSAALACVHEWLDDYPGEWDWEWATLSGRTTQGKALNFFRYAEDEVIETLNVVIVEGDHPGSSYYAAELRMPIDEANAAARREGIPLLFKPLM
jgi:hypothetical protein